MLSTVVSVNLALISLQENEVTKRLASYAALIAVPTLIVGVYGMNFEHMPELGWRFGYPFALGGIVADRRLAALSVPQGEVAVAGRLKTRPELRTPNARTSN